MALMNNKPDSTNTIADIENYYAKKRSGRGRAWLMALISLATTVAIIVGVFFGARWIVSMIQDDDDANSIATTQTTEVAPEEEGQASVTIVPNDVDPNTADEGATDSNATNDSAANADAEDNTTTSDDFPSIVSDEAVATATPQIASNTQSDESTTSANSNRQVAGASTTELPATGAGSATVIIPLFAGVAGYALHRRSLLKSE